MISAEDNFEGSGAVDHPLPMLEVTHTSTVTADQIDHLGHMNVRFYGVNAHAATRNMLQELDGWPNGPHLVHDTYTRHHHEQLVGTPLEVRSAYLGASPEGLRIHHELASADGSDLAAVFVHHVSPIDETGMRRPVPENAVKAAGAALVEPLPYAASRTVDLALDPMASSPSLDLVRQRGLEIRKPRLITPQEGDRHGYFNPDMTMMLMWGGEAPDHVDNWGPDLHEGPGGELMGWAVMETRIQLSRLPRVGTRIQSFGATIAIHQRAVHRLHWCFDIDAGDVLACFEGVDVAFDTRARRTMVIPERFVRRFERSHYRDLAPARS
jgi:acyl-CoA thioesterase FadM